VAKTPYKGEFKFVSVDPVPPENKRPSLPSWLKKVPTLVISGEPNPRTDAEVLNWLYERKMKDEGQRGGHITTGKGGPPPDEGPQPYGILGGGDAYNDPYTFLDQDTMAQGNGGLQGMEKNFSFLNGSSANGTREGGSMNTIEVVGKVSKKEQMFDNQMKSYMSARDEGMPKGPNRM